MFDPKRYKEVHSREGSGAYGDFGLKIMIAVDRELTDDEKRLLNRKAEEIENEVMAQSVKLDPRTVARVAEDKAQLIGLFHCPVWVEQIANGYSQDYWYRNFPWYRVTTPVGPIVIGWRKRVIEINWRGSTITAKAEELFPDEDVTRVDQLIHAWSIEKAQQYIDKLMLQRREGNGNS